MQSSYCPKCRKFLTPEIEKCPACGFNRKKYYDKKFYTPNSTNSSSPDMYGEGLNIFWKFRIFILPISFIWILIFAKNKRQRNQGLTIFVASVLLFTLILYGIYLVYYSHSYVPK